MKHKFFIAMLLGFLVFIATPQQADAHGKRSRHCNSRRTVVIRPALLAPAPLIVVGRGPGKIHRHHRRHHRHHRRCGR